MQRTVLRERKFAENVAHANEIRLVSDTRFVSSRHKSPLPRGQVEAKRRLRCSRNLASPFSPLLPLAAQP